VAERDAVLPGKSLPGVWIQLDGLLRPVLLEAIPKEITAIMNTRAITGHWDDSHIVLFFLMKYFAPGGNDEIFQVITQIRNPQVCVIARSALKELMKWKEAVLRCQQLGCRPPELIEIYRAMESIFIGVFEKAEPQLNMQWLSLRIELGLPHNINDESFKRI
jgi:hypothetical protein